MKIVMRRTLVAGGVTLALSGIAFAANDAGVIGKAKNSVHADQVAPSTENITVNKTMFDQKDAAKFAASANKIKNDGTVKDLPDGLLKYSPETMGKIEFSLFDITKAVNAHYTDNKGLTGFSDSQSGEVTGRVQEIANAIKANETGSEYTSGSNVKKIATQAIDVNGQTTFSGVKAYDTSMPQKYHYYAIVETKTPKGFVNQKSDPIVFVAPYTNPSGDGFLSNVNLYPKNNTKKLTFKLTKYEDQNAGADGKVSARTRLAGAKFQLYRGTPGGKDTVGDPITTDSNGSLSVGNLVMGSYYFVELPSANVSADGSAGTGLQLSPIAMNNSNNKLRFTIDENGATSEDLQGQVDNYGRPDITKKLTNGIGSSQSLHIGDLAKFTSKVTVPRDLLGSAYAMGANETLTKNLPYHEFNTVDTPETHLKDVPSLRDLVIKTPDGTVLKEGTDYNIIQGKNFWTVDYITQGLSDADKAATKTTVDTVANLKKMLTTRTTGHVTDEVAKFGGQDFTYTYNQVVMGDAPMDTNIINDITLGWNNGTGHHEITKNDHTITYGVHFVKESSGFFGIGAKKLQGAQFAVQDKRTGKWFNGFKAAKDTKSGEPEAQWVDDWKDVKAGTKTSDKNGKFELQGFTEGDYKLRETKAPDGYQLMEETVDFKIGPKTDAVTISNPILIKNNEKASMPLTGSQQKIVVVAGAVATLVVVGAIAGYKLRIKLKD
ncbi:cell wall anchor protein [Lactobacillus plantarum]|uniref:SpaA isopeptide-forming pilin-related protein n=1 Tax=Lactiplantibacillus plantarum TaxID=1590 RepID=UPI00136BE9E4|nr:SpaA isopeptide-forming pilin-related protein [Lactiplantibacillus plantarum]MYU99193.1 cell wall anchor protein [Lactiplantibacillus plantarum]